MVVFVMLCSSGAGATFGTTFTVFENGSATLGAIEWLPNSSVKEPLVDGDHAVKLAGNGTELYSADFSVRFDPVYAQQDTSDDDTGSGSRSETFFYRLPYEPMAERFLVTHAGSVLVNSSIPDRVCVADGECPSYCRYRDRSDVDCTATDAGPTVNGTQGTNATQETPGQDGNSTGQVEEPQEPIEDVTMVLEYKGQLWRSAGEDDADAADWVPVASVGAAPRQVTVADGDYFALRVTSGAERGSVVFEREGIEQDPYAEAYNDRGDLFGDQGIIHQVEQGTSDELFVRFRRGGETLEASIGVHGRCQGAEAWTGEECARALNLVAVPLEFDQEGFDRFYDQMEEFAWGWARRSPLKERAEPRQYINIQYLEPVVTADPPTSRCFFNIDRALEGGHEQTAAYTAMEEAQDSRYASTYHRAIAIYDGDLTFTVNAGGFEYDRNIAGCNPLDWKLDKVWPGARDVAVAEYHDGAHTSAEVLYHEMGHSYGFCHSMGAPDASGSCSARIPFDPMRVVVRTLTEVGVGVSGQTLDQPAVFAGSSYQWFGSAAGKDKMREAMQAVGIEDRLCPNEAGTVAQTDKIMNYCGGSDYFLGDPAPVGSPSAHDPADYRAYDYLVELYDSEYGLMGDPPDRTPLQQGRDWLFSAGAGVEDAAAQYVCQVPLTCDSAPGYAYDGLTGAARYGVNGMVGAMDHLGAGVTGLAGWSGEMLTDPGLETLGDGLSGAAGWSTSATVGTTETLGDGAQQAIDYASDGVEGAQETVSDGLDDAQEAVESGTETFCERMWCP